MKALTLKQPWATLVAIGAKQIETRSWNTNYRGPLAIHASKIFDGDDFLLCSTHPFREVLYEAGYMAFSSMPLGKIIAFCYLRECIKIEADIYQFYVNNNKGEYKFLQIPPFGNELHFGDYTPGRYAWILTDIQQVRNPIPARGSFGLWNWEGGMTP